MIASLYQSGSVALPAFFTCLSLVTFLVQCGYASNRLAIRNKCL